MGRQFAVSATNDIHYFRVLIHIAKLLFLEMFTLSSSLKMKNKTWGKCVHIQMFVIVIKVSLCINKTNIQVPKICQV